MNDKNANRPSDEDGAAAVKAEGGDGLDAGGDRPVPRLAFDGSAAGFAARLKRVRVAAILDDFSYVGFRHECDIRQLVPDGWREELESFQPELLLVESAWRGKDRLWQGRIARLDQELDGVLRWCHLRGIPTVFWNKEDPVHFRTFKRIAKRFDYIFTTDVDSVVRYKAVLGHERAYLLPFACQPRVHNPIERETRKEAFSFAGGYYARYPERIRDFREIIGALTRFWPVDIFDRGQGIEDSRYRFPPEYAPLIVDTLPFDQIDRAYKGYRFGINFNSMKWSQSMFARRIFELLASNTLTISNYARGLRLMFGDLVVVSDGGEEILRLLADLTVDGAKAAKIRLAALRKTIGEHAAEDRFAYLVSKVAGVQVPFLTPGFVMLSQTANEAAAARIFEAFRRQTYAAKRLVLVVPDRFVPAGLEVPPGVRLISASTADSTRASDIARPDEWVALVNSDDYYGPNYLLDVALATRYAPGPVIGKVAHYARSTEGVAVLVEPGKAYRIVGKVAAQAGAIRADALGPSIGVMSHLRAGTLDDPQALSIDPFNYCRDGATGDEALRGAVDDLEGLDIGLSVAAMAVATENIRLVEHPTDTLPLLTGAELAPMFRSARFIKFADDGGRLRVYSSLAAKQWRNCYAYETTTPEGLGAKHDTIRAHMIATPGLHLRLAIRFVDAAGEELGTDVSNVNRDVKFDLPKGTVGVQLGVRVSGSGTAFVLALLLDHRFSAPITVLSHGDHLVLTDRYPSYDAPELGVDVHCAVLTAKADGHVVDVFRLSPMDGVTYHEYESIDCITGHEAALEALLAMGRHRSVEVHAADEARRAIFAHHAERLKALNSSIQPSI